ncbi:MAG: FAD-dependent oxidoreductase [Acidimicrobiaceae bacterium]|jgi:glycine/D-amino acid oxidase-like deaminating enzyme|nr:FAD-dependent oxidoreductase [Acidimicrobiaceae bacterium]MDP6481381.1 FAD-binding oxidoreductase [Acidimicrobiales bacterium]MDP6697036.1 FAD-binding oxidoreductase [Acidimicrobiales bacterium]|tara:strand:- start:1941 stop:3443 length:1503 start_codon:yes stop_codon:yes gene_type:complete
MEGTDHQAHGAASRSLTDTRSAVFWLDRTDPPQPADTLNGRTTADLVVGAGFTGLWTALIAAEADPGRRITVIEAETAAFGASGRNGGFCEASLTHGLANGLAHWPDEIDTLLRLGDENLDALMDAIDRHAIDCDAERTGTVDIAVEPWQVDDIGRVTTAEGIDCHYAKGGSISWARNRAQLSRLKAGVSARHAVGLTSDDISMLGQDEARAVGNATDALGARFMAHVAAVHPARLVRGLADVVERLGVTIYEGTAALSTGDGAVPTEHGTVTAEIVVRATEGYTRDLKGQRRAIAPFYSLMVATEPLSQDVLDEIGLADRPTFADGRNMTIYGQRTADGRLAFGGRGAPYRYGSRIDPAVEQASPVHDRIVGTLRDLFPVLAGTGITHRWGGVLGIPRDWFPTVSLDRSAGLAHAGGYAGDGVAAAKLAGHTLAELITGTESERTDLPWVGHVSRRWAPEPFRWMGINSGLWAARSGDRAEARTGRPSRRVELLHRLLR